MHWKRWKPMGRYAAAGWPYGASCAVTPGVQAGMTRFPNGAAAIATGLIPDPCLAMRATTLTGKLRYTLTNLPRFES